jgi:hypothetical protein
LHDLALTPPELIDTPCREGRPAASFRAVSARSGLCFDAAKMRADAERSLRKKAAALGFELTPRLSTAT